MDSSVFGALLDGLFGIGRALRLALWIGREPEEPTIDQRSAERLLPYAVSERSAAAAAEEANRTETRGSEDDWRWNGSAGGPTSGE